MAANRTRVQVRGSTGKSIRFPVSTVGSGAQIGVDLRLPDGSVPTLAQLAAALATGAALNDLPGNISPGTGGVAIIWNTITHVPAQILYAPRSIAEDGDAEDYPRMAVAGPPGVRGPQGFPSGSPDDGEDPGLIPGAAGPVGPAGAPGAPGATTPVHMYMDDAEDPGLIPGASGPAGQPGASIQGSPGVTIPMYPEDPEDPGLIPGAAGPVGKTGSTGAPGVTIPMYPDDAEDALPIPGIQGPIGPQGTPGSSSSASGTGWAAYLEMDAPEDFIHVGAQQMMGTANEIVVAGQTISFAPNIVVPAPAAGTTLTLNTSTAGDISLVLGNTGGNGAYMQFLNGANTVAYAGASFNISGFGTANDWGVRAGTGGALYFFTNGGTVPALAIASSGAVSIPAPATGAALTLTANAASQIGIFNGPAANAYFDYQRAGVLVGRIGSADSILVGGAATDFAIVGPNGGLSFGTTGSTSRLHIDAAGVVNVVVGPLTVAGTPVALATSNSFTGTLTGCTTSPTGTFSYRINGNSVTIDWPNILGTSNTTAATITGMPAALTPARTQVQLAVVENAGAISVGLITISGTTITLNSSITGSAFTASGTKGIQTGSATYNLT